MINIDLIADWVTFVQNEMVSLGLVYNSALSPEENTLRLFTAKRRIVPKRCRIVYEARELRVPSALAGDYAALKSLIQAGGDLIPFLSRDLQKGRADKHDRLLNAWDVHHLHFRPEGTCDVLFVRFTTSEAYILKTLPHGHRYPESWVETSLLRILQSNWPDSAPGITTSIQPEDLNPAERVALRQKNTNFAVEMADGSVCIGHGGLTASGHSILDVMHMDSIFADLARWKRILESNEATIRKALEFESSSDLSIRMAVVAGECWLYEPISKRRLLVTLQPCGPTL